MPLPLVSRSISPFTPGSNPAASLRNVAAWPRTVENRGDNWGLIVGWTGEIELRTRWTAGEKFHDIRAAMNMTEGQLRGRITRLNLPARHTMRRGVTLGEDHPAVVEGHTLFRTTIRTPDHNNVLKPGSYSRKLGKVVQKGRWKDFPIFMLTLEERATCPRHCKQWASCYGNNMPLARRMAVGETLLPRLRGELAVLSRLYPHGFVIRLHVLGDFYSVEYVEFWQKMLERHPALHVFGYTARRSTEKIGRALHRLRTVMWDRFSIRSSDGAEPEPRTMVIGRGDRAPTGSVIFPVETGKTRSCATCGLCWNSKVPIAFLRH